MFTQPHLHPAWRALRLVLPALLAVAIALVLLLPGSASTDVLRQSGSSKSATQHTVLTVEPKHPGKKLALGAVGLSIEAKELATQDLSASHRSLVALMRLLGPGVLRIGGGSVDYSWWTGNDEPAPVWATSVVTPSDLATLDRLLAETGWKVILGINLGQFDPTRAANEAGAAQHIFGSRLLGFEIGNEPDDYGKLVIKLRPSSYSPGNYLEELAAYGAAMRATTPRINLYGPDLSSQTWLSTIASSKSTSFAAITQHYYPTTYSLAKGGCKATPVPTALELLSPQVRELENVTLQTLVRVGEIAHSKTRISETNATGSCDTDGGPETSPVFASALWSLDWALRATSAGVVGLNFHGYFGHCAPYTASPICAESYAAESKGRVSARPEFYGLLAARQLEGGQFIPIHITEPGTMNDLTAYATTHPHGEVTVAIDNLATEGPTFIVLKVPGYDRATGERLVGPATSATSGVTYGQGSINEAGSLRSTGTGLRKVGHAFHLELAPASAIVIRLHK